MLVSDAFADEAESEDVELSLDDVDADELVALVAPPAPLRWSVL